MTGNMTLEARWRAPETFTVKFMNDTNLVLSVNVEEGQTAPTSSVPKDPTKAEYKFVGWFVGNKEWNKTEPVTASLEITAKWEQNAVDPDPSKPTYTVTFTGVGHKYGAYKVTKAATVLKAGEKVRTCSVCGATQ